VHRGALLSRKQGPSSGSGPSELYSRRGRAPAAFAAPLTPVRCLGEDSNQLPAKATKELPPELLSLFRQKKVPKHSPILVRIFKEEAELEVWKQDVTADGRLAGRTRQTVRDPIADEGCE
jgi:hypothetical protein